MDELFVVDGEGVFLGLTSATGVVFDLLDRLRVKAELKMTMEEVAHPVLLVQVVQQRLHDDCLNEHNRHCCSGEDGKGPNRHNLTSNTTHKHNRRRKRSKKHALECFPVGVGQSQDRAFLYCFYLEVALPEVVEHKHVVGADTNDNDNDRQMQT